MEFKILFDGNISQHVVNSVIEDDDSGFEIDPRSSLHSSITDPTLLASVAVIGSLLNAAQLAASLWQIRNAAKSDSNEASELQEIRIELPTGVVVSVPADNPELTEKLLNKLVAGELASDEHPRGQ